MKKATRTALEDSIDKWEGIVAGKIRDEGSANCPLCSLFLGAPSCGRCPVKVTTRKGLCKGSPYEAWAGHQWSRRCDSNKNAYRATDKRSKKLAQAELDFLISLRPS